MSSREDEPRESLGLSDEEVSTEYEAIRLVREARVLLSRAGGMTSFHSEDIACAIECLPSESQWERQVEEERNDR